MSQVSAALAVAHRHGIVHRDLKPHNIMLARDGNGREVAKLVDFGVAKTFDQATQLTQTGFVVGTPQYMAPEQAEGKPVDGRSDIYSLGVILYEMLSGDVPFDDPSTPMILIKHIKDAPVPPSVKNPDAHVSPALEAVAMRCLQKDPAARFQSAEEFSSALDAVPMTPAGQQPTLRVDRTAVTVPTPMPQQKTAVGQTAPPLNAMNAANTMSAPPVVSDPRPSVIAAVQPPKSTSSTARVLIAGAVLVVGLVAGAWYVFGRSSPEPSSAPATTTAQSSPPAEAAPPTSTPPPQPGAAPLPSKLAGVSPSAAAAPPTGKPEAASSAAPAVAAPSAAAPPPAVQSAVQPAQAPAVTAFPANPAVAVRCVGPNEICSPIRTSVEEALQKAGMRALRDPGRADVVVEVNVTPVSEHANSDFGTTLAVRTFSLDIIGEAPKLGDSVPMPSVSPLSYDPRFGAERVNEKARLVADGIVEKVRDFADKKR